MSDLVELQVYYEDGKLQTLWLTPEDYEKAKNDEQFVLSLLQKPKHVKRSVSSIVNENDVSSIVNENDVPSLNEKDISLSVQEKEDTSKHIWTDAEVLLLLDMYKNREDDFSKGKKRHNYIWTEISEEMKHVNYNVSGTQCSMKLAGLKRTYKQIKDNNKKSGNERSTWVLYSVVDNVFGKKAWVEPQNLASSDSVLPSDNICNEDTIPPNPKKRKVEKILENYMEEVKNEKVAEQVEKAKKEETKNKLKTERYNERKQEKKVMHEEKMNVMKEMIQVLKDMSNQK